MENKRKHQRKTALNETLRLIRKKKDWYIIPKKKPRSDTRDSCWRCKYIYLHHNFYEMDIENWVQEQEIKDQETIAKNVNTDLHASVDEVNIENQVQE